MSDNIIEVRNVSYGHGSNRVLDNISMDIPKGKLVMITGLSGCGKTTLLKIIAGLIEPDQGSVSIDGVDIFMVPRLKLFEMRRKMAFMFQDGALLSNLSIFDNIALPLRYHYNLPQDEIEKRVLSLLDSYGLKSLQSELPGSLSMIQRKLAGVARALVMEPTMIFADEPIGFMDVVAREQLSNMLIQMRDDPEVTLIAVGHNIEFIKMYADYIGILHDQRLFAYGEKNEILKSRDPVLQRILSIIIDETEMLAESVLGVMRGDINEQH